MLFCPFCGNCLLIERGSEKFQFFCKLCDYKFPILAEIKTVLQVQTKQVDDILGGKETWEAAEKCEGKGWVFILVLIYFSSKMS